MSTEHKRKENVVLLYPKVNSDDKEVLPDPYVV